MAYFRADKRDFLIDDEIRTAGEFVDKFPDASKIVEETLELHRPNSKPKRRSCLFLFDDLENAKNHWSIMSNGKLYEVEIDENYILHRGDMALTEDLKKMADNQADMKGLAQRYWAGSLTKDPVLEYLVPVGTVVNVIISSQIERREFLKQKWKLFD